MRPMTIIVVCDASAAWRVSSRNESQVALCSESKYAEQSSYHTETERERGSGVLPPSQSNSVEFMRIFFSNESLTTMRDAPSAGRCGHCLSSGGNFSGQELEVGVTFLLLSFYAFPRTHALASFFFRVVRALVWC